MKGEQHRLNPLASSCISLSTTKLTEGKASELQIFINDLITCTVLSLQKYLS
jgi:hypothetical protein